MKLTPALFVFFALSINTLFSQSRLFSNSPKLIDTTGTSLNTYIYGGIGAGEPFILLSLSFMAEVEEHYCITLGSDLLGEINIGGGGDEYHTLNFMAGYGAAYKSLHGVMSGGIVIVFTEIVHPVISFKTDFIFTKNFGIGGEFRLLIGDGIGHGRAGNFFGILNLVVKF